MLADELEPLVLADGTVINPATGKAVKQDRARPSYIEVPNGQDAQALIVKTRKTIGDLPLPPAQLSGVALVAFYTLFGLPDSEISVATDGKLSIPQVKQIRQLDAYKDFMLAAKTNIMETATDQVRDLFQKQAVGAAQKVIELAQSDNDVLAFKASQDVLDRAGHRPADIVEHRHKMEDVLNIVITKRDDTVQVPVLDITPTRVVLEE